MEVAETVTAVTAEEEGGTETPAGLIDPAAVAKEVFTPKAAAGVITSMISSVQGE